MRAVSVDIFVPDLRGKNSQFFTIKNCYLYVFVNGIYNLARIFFIVNGCLINLVIKLPF